MKYLLVFIVFTLGTLSIICLADIESCLVAQAQQKLDGKLLYKKHCMNCHSEEGMASVLTPMHKTKPEWEAFFTEGKHLGNDIVNLATEEKIAAIALYCTTNAKIAADMTESNDTAVSQTQNETEEK